ncbi:MAG TPA: hypothetical protein VEP90_09370, partial [Methylomirabilota bacterium]|nr:hypothetical protein [Methylomirabilota bacterium]
MQERVENKDETKVKLAPPGKLSSVTETAKETSTYEHSRMQDLNTKDRRILLYVFVIMTILVTITSILAYVITRIPFSSLLIITVAMIPLAFLQSFVRQSTSQDKELEPILEERVEIRKRSNGNIMDKIDLGLN